MMFAARFAALAVVALVTACPATGEDVRPPADQLYFPTGLAIAPSEDVLFAVNANSDLRFASGLVQVIDLEKIDTAVDAWLSTEVAPAGCEKDSALPLGIVCDETPFIVADGSVRVGNFATDVGVQDLGGDLRLFVAVRGDPSLTWIDYDSAARDLSCGGQGPVGECDDAHRLTQMREDFDLAGFVDEPFGVYVDSQNEYVMVTHLSSGAVSVADAPADGSPPVLSDVIAGLFAANPNTGVRGAVGIAGRSPGAEGGRVYVTSRSESRIQTLYVSRPAQYPILVPSEYFFLNGVRPSDDSRGIAFGRGGDRAYVVNRDPPMLQSIDTSLGRDGVPKNELLSAVEICSGASNIAVADLGEGERVYIACFRDGQIWTVNPTDARLRTISDVGRGAHALVVAPGRRRLYVSNFLEDTIAVLDLTPGSRAENRVVMRLGTPRQAGGSK